MITLGMTGTKWEIFKISIELFSKNGYSAVSLRDIANKFGIKAASIYNHFSSKDDILNQCYKFYEANFNAKLPNMDKLLKLIGKKDPHEILKKCIYFYENKLHIIMENCLFIAQEESARDKRAEMLIYNTFFKSYKEYYGKVLSKMIEMDEIEPLDINSFIGIISNYDYASAFRNYTNFAVLRESWVAERELILNLIQVKKDKKIKIY